MNAGKRCGKQKQCPHNKLHKCCFVLPGGILCGNTNHGKADCPHANKKKENTGGQDGGGRQGYDYGKWSKRGSR